MKLPARERNISTYTNVNQRHIMSFYLNLSHDKFGITGQLVEILTKRTTF